MIRENSLSVSQVRKGRNSVEGKDYLGLVFNKVYSMPTYAGVQLAGEVIEDIVQKGGEILYDKFLNSLIPAHAKNYLFQQLTSILGQHYEAYDRTKNECLEMEEKDLSKLQYDSHCTFAMKVERAPRSNTGRAPCPVPAFASSTASSARTSTIFTR